MVKVLLGGLFSLIPIVNFVVFGAAVTYLKNVAEGREELPEWNEFGDLWIKGLLSTVALFIYFIPAWILFAIGVVPVFLASMSSGNTESLAGAAFKNSSCSTSSDSSTSWPSPSSSVAPSPTTR